MAQRENRGFPREKLRVVCDLLINGATHSGFVLDVSAKGLFVQTRATVPDDCEIEIRLRDLGPTPIVLRARVARRSVAHRATASVETGGVGLEIVAAGEDFYLALQERLR